MHGGYAMDEIVFGSVVFAGQIRNGYRTIVQSSDIYLVISKASNVIGKKRYKR